MKKELLTQFMKLGSSGMLLVILTFFGLWLGNHVDIFLNTFPNFTILFSLLFIAGVFFKIYKVAKAQ